MDPTLNQATVKNCTRWLLRPPYQMEMGTNLNATPSGIDFASKRGCKSQCLTSWNCISRCYVGGVVITPGCAHQPQPEPEPAQLEADVPTPEELALMTKEDRDMFDRNLKHFVRGHGLLTTKEWHLRASHPRPRRDQDPQVQERDAVLGVDGDGRPVRAENPAQDPPPPPDQNLGFYYSDIVPVRTLSVSFFMQQREVLDPLPYSPLFQSLAGCLSDPAQTGELGAEVCDFNARYLTYLSLVKSLMNEPSTRFEIAAMIRAAPMVLSVNSEIYDLDPITYIFVRKANNVRDLGTHIMQKPGIDPADWEAISMPLDTFVAVANGVPLVGLPEQFHPNSLDSNWVAIPVECNTIRKINLVPYVMSFLSSDAWSGTTYHVKRTDRTGPNNTAYTMTETYLPCINYIHVPGTTRVCLVYTDYIEQAEHFALEPLRLSCGNQSVQVPYYNGKAPVVPVNFWNVWDAFWSNDNINNIASDCIRVYKYICTRLAVENACGTALSIISELYGIWYGGIALQSQQEKPSPNYAALPLGAYTYDGSTLDHTGQIRSRTFNLNQANKYTARRRAVAYNFSGISPMHLQSISIVRIRYVLEDGIIKVSWATQTPERCYSTYNISTMNSVTRMGAFSGLLLTDENSYIYFNASRITTLVHMLACAVSFTTSSFLSINDISPRNWAGMNDRYTGAYLTQYFSSLKNAMYAGIIAHPNVRHIFSQIQEWDLDILEYWSIEGYNNVQWLTFSPVPFHCTWQWIMKMGLVGGVAPSTTSYSDFIFNEAIYHSLMIDASAQEHKCNTPATFDVYRQFPQILVCEVDSRYVVLYHWFDSVSAYSNCAAKASYRIAWDLYESLTFCPNVRKIGLPSTSGNNWRVILPHYAYYNYTEWLPYITSIK